MTYQGRLISIAGHFAFKRANSVENLTLKKLRKLNEIDRLSIEIENCREAVDRLDRYRGFFRRQGLRCPICWIADKTEQQVKTTPHPNGDIHQCPRCGWQDQEPS